MPGARGRSTDRARLDAELAITRERGWALEDGEFDLRRRSLGAVVRDHRGTAVAAVGIAGWTREIPDERIPELARQVMAEAEAISEALGRALGALAQPRLHVSVLGAVEPPVPPVARTDVPEGRRTPKRSGAAG